MIAGLLLAAGAGSRFGAQKLLRPLAQKPLVRWSAESLGAATDYLVIVVPPDGTAMRQALNGVKAHFVINADPRRGLGRSIACGVQAMPSEADAVVVALADEPLLDPRWIDAVVATYRSSPGTAIVASVFRGTRRHPVLFDRAVYGELAGLDGDRGARDVVERDASRVAVVEYDEAGTIDVDTPDDLARLEQAAQFTTPPMSPTSVVARAERNTSS